MIVSGRKHLMLGVLPTPPLPRGSLLLLLDVSELSPGAFLLPAVPSPSSSSASSMTILTFATFLSLSI